MPADLAKAEEVRLVLGELFEQGLSQKWRVGAMVEKAQRKPFLRQRGSL